MIDTNSVIGMRLSSQIHMDYLANDKKYYHEYLRMHAMRQLIGAFGYCYGKHECGEVTFAKDNVIWAQF